MKPSPLIFGVCLAWIVFTAAYYVGLNYEADSQETTEPVLLPGPTLYKTEYRSERIRGASTPPVWIAEDGDVMLDRIYGCAARETEARHLVKIDPTMRRDKIDWTKVESFEVHYELWNVTTAERIESTYGNAPVRFEAPPDLAFERSQELLTFVGEKVRVWWSPIGREEVSRPVSDRLYDIELVSVTLKSDN